MSTASRHEESHASVLIGGLMVVAFGWVAVIVAISLGSLAAALVGAVLLVLAGTAPVTDTARVLRMVVTGLGISALACALVELLT